MQDAWSPGSAADADALALLLMQTQFVYRSPASPEAAALLSLGSSRLRWGNGKLLCALAVDGIHIPVTDLCLCACANPGCIFTDGLTELERQASECGVRWLRILDAPGWLMRTLVNTYQYIDTIVFYERDNQPPDSLPALAGVTLHGIQMDDLDAILTVDAQCFAPIWQASRAEIESWLAKAQYAFTLQADGQVFAYILAAHRKDNGHIFRLAVKPQWQGQAWGRWLMTCVIQQMLAVHVRSFTLNTQASNQRSKKLYERLGFKLTAKSASVYAKELKSSPSESSA
ncbi:MAG: GNAT family N-acetyltransferase [Chloroflexi bacterium]|nr:GNAT family N-acetyltransferase [Chloroflexota bacterium]